MENTAISKKMEIQESIADEIQLIEMAKKARETAYAPYSNFHVGAALLAEDGRIFTGCNIENVSYSATNCAERTAFFKAISEGVRSFQAIAIISDSKECIAPCGVCRQVMVEFCGPEFLVIMCDANGNYKKKFLAELMPEMFNRDMLN